MEISAKKIEKMNSKLGKIRDYLSRIDLKNKFESSADDLNLISEAALNLRNYVNFMCGLINKPEDEAIAIEDFEKEINDLLYANGIHQEKIYGEIDDIDNLKFYETIKNRLIKRIEKNKVVLPDNWKKVLEKNILIWYEDDGLPF